MPKIVRKIIPNSNKNNPNLYMDPQYITLHETNNYHPRADALMHANFVLGGGGSANVSWGYTVDDGEYIYQHLEDNEVGWHGGDGFYGTGNRRSIGIESCVNKGIDISKRNANLVWLINVLMERNPKITKVRIVPHKKWSGKNCPTAMLKYWDDIISRVGKKVDFEFVDDGLLSIGDKGKQVEKLQKELVDLGYKISIDGDFGPNTEKAVMSFQKKAGLRVDGIVGPNTQAEINAELKKHDGILEEGEKGNDVKELQVRLNKLGFDAGEPDGVFGPTTLKAVKAFQKAMKLSQDGIVGPATLKALDQLEISKQKEKEEDEMEEVAVVYHSMVDRAMNEDLMLRLNCGSFERHVAEKREVAKKVLVVGGSVGKVKGNAVLLAGDNRDKTRDAVHKYLDKL